MPKNTTWEITSLGEISERIPRVAGAFWFALPFQSDDTVEWADYFAGSEARAFLMGIRPEGHAQEGRVYPLDLDVVNGSDETAAAAEVSNFIGVMVEGANYVNDQHFTVTLAGGIPLRYIQQTQVGPNAVDAYTVDPAVVEAAPKLGLKIINKHIFWNVSQSGNQA